MKNCIPSSKKKYKFTAKKLCAYNNIISMNTDEHITIIYQKHINNNIVFKGKLQFNVLVFSLFCFGNEYTFARLLLILVRRIENFLNEFYCGFDGVW